MMASTPEPRMIDVTISVKSRRSSFDALARATLSMPVTGDHAALVDEVRDTIAKVVAQAQRLDPDA